MRHRGSSRRRVGGSDWANVRRLRALRYASVIAAPEGWRAYFEAAAADGSHELRTVVLPTPPISSAP
jgi:hypothetical protein